MPKKVNKSKINLKKSKMNTIKNHILFSIINQFNLFIMIKPTLAEATIEVFSKLLVGEPEDAQRFADERNATQRC